MHVIGTKLVEVAFRQKSWGKRMPMAWVPLDLQLNEMRSHNTTLISKEYLTSLLYDHFHHALYM